ncbi:MAG TPA: extracellular solute-binding protein [Chloroflexota bacterium]|nr:extracellular solute-binding protein [Chloroflexota bacterium]
MSSIVERARAGTRRNALIALGGTTGAALLAACGAGGSGTPAAGGQAGRAGQTQPVSGKLSIWWPSVAFDPASTIVGEVQQSFATQYPGVTVDAIVEGSGDKLKTTVAAGTPPDLFHTQSYWQTTWGVTGVVTQLDDYIKSSKTIKPEDVWPLKLKEVQNKGKTWALPYSIDSRVIYINADHYARAGYDLAKPPKTWDELERTLPSLTKASGPGEVSQFAFDPFFGSGGTQRWLVPFWQLGGEFHSADGSKITIANDRGIQALEWCNKLFKAQGGWPALEKAQTGVTPQYRLFLQNSVSYYYDTFSNKAQNFNREAPDFKFGFMDYPKPPNGKTANYAGGWALCLPKGAKNPEASFRFMEYLYTPEIDLKWHTYHLRVPVHQAVAKSVDYTRNDPFLKLTVDGMSGGAFVASIPGGEGILPIVDSMVKKVRSEQMNVRDALKEAEDLCQQEVDKLRSS